MLPSLQHMYCTKIAYQIKVSDDNISHWKYIEYDWHNLTAIKMKNPNPDINSLFGRLATASCSTPAEQKNIPFSRIESIAKRR
mmetsp:Transcript_24954/g.45129  ORF Transcript_24954/g.45129 Transcript_24954/m.45129 type:complete len:83 (-) Transcript_24954:32-280(-)